MPNERVIPSEQAKTVVTTTVLSDGNEVSQTYHVLSIVVSKEVNRIPSAIIIFSDGEPSKESFEISSSPDFEPGKEIEIKNGYRSDEETLFKGIVIKHSIKSRKKSSMLIVECRDKAVKMTNVAKSKYFKDLTDSDIMEEVIDTYGIDKEVEATTITQKQVVQYGSTDWDFVLCRCDANGLLCIANDGKLTIAKPDFTGETVLTVQFGATVHELDAEIDARFQFKTIKGSTWNYTDQELMEDTAAEEPAVPEAGNLSANTLAEVIGEEEMRLSHSGKMEEPELQAWVNAKMMKHRLAKIRGSVKIDGTAAVSPGQIIQLNGAGERFEGKLFVTGVRHQVDNGNWETILQFGVNPDWFAQTFDLRQPLSGALLPGIEGLQIGIATKLEGDPDGEDRIMVRLPLIHKDDEGIWSRICTLDAGEKRGTFFRPEINDELIIGFINNDPRHAVILGMVNSSAKAAPLPTADDNHEKGYVSRSEMKLIFNDDKKSISIETPGGNKLIITEEDKKIHMEDQNGNKLTMNEDGIKLDSIKDIILKASGDVKMEGTNMNMKGSAQTKVEGGSCAEISSGGTTNVKGSMVNIN
jgi:Rhs element Vgr protein